MRFFREILTAKDNHTFEIGHVATFVGVISYNVYSYYAYVVNLQDFDPVQWGLGYAGIVGLGCAGIAVKENTNPVKIQTEEKPS